MAKQESSGKINVDGKVTAVLPGTKYKVEIEIQGLKHELIGYPSGKIRKNYIKLKQNDEVIVEMDPQYDINQGRIVWKKSIRNGVAAPVPESLKSAA